MPVRADSGGRPIFSHSLRERTARVPHRQRRRARQFGVVVFVDRRAEDRHQLVADVGRQRAVIGENISVILSKYSPRIADDLGSASSVSE